LRVIMKEVVAINGQEVIFSQSLKVIVFGVNL